MINLTRANIIKKTDKFTPFGGINFIDNYFRTSGLSNLIDENLGMRVKYAGYSYEEIIRNLYNIFFSGGNCAEDINKHLRASLSKIPGNIVPSADTVLRIFNELASSNTEVVSVNGNKYQFNINEKLNDLNIQALLKLNLIETTKEYDLDYDNQILAHEKYDAKSTYKKNEGYFPGIASIGNNIVYLENRDGNANVKLEQSTTLTRTFELLSKHNININRFRADAGSYSKEIIDVVSKHSKQFYIRANKCVELTSRIHAIKDWQVEEINYKNYEVATIPFTTFFAERNYRLVVMREKLEDLPSLFPEYDYVYRCILTNDHTSSEAEVIDYYNQRGASEKIFDVQNNDFGWGHLPCSDMDKNTVYLILMALCKNFYNYVVTKVSTVFADIKPTSRLKRFIFSFISVAGKWIKHGRQQKLVLYTDRPYEQLLI